MDILSVHPKILIQICENLETINLLNCRLVSKTWKTQADCNLKSKCQLRFQDVKCLQRFLQSGIDVLPITNVTIEFPLQLPLQLQSNIDLIHFLEKYSSQITSLKIASTTADSNSSTNSTPAPIVVITLVDKWMSENILKTQSSEESALLAISSSQEMDENGNIVISDDLTGKKLKIQDEGDNNKNDDVENISPLPQIEDKPAILEKTKPPGTETDTIETVEVIDVEEKKIQTPEIAKTESFPDFHTEIHKVENSQEIRIPIGSPDTFPRNSPKIPNSPSATLKSETGFRVRFVDQQSASKIANPEYLPVPINPEGYDAFTEFYPYYLGRHFDSRNRRLHVIGTLNAVFLFVIGIVTFTPVLFLVGISLRFACIWMGHWLFEQRRCMERSLKNFMYSIMGDCRLSWEVASGQRAF